MKCPLCNVDLIMSERQGIEIDYCPQCRGVWLDRGELDKIIERSTSLAAPAAAPSASYASAPERYDERRYEDKYRDDYYKKGKKKKRGDFLGDLFDFGD
ncbi:zf-TFIIB domain-containing protein [Paraeggerthella hongkongensis]|uniref:TFIIB-type zinc ribbon-containing protein n=1 Tax=Paraeggerthella hominis TaxID=2897351 RepID=UPI001C0FFCEA|nr:MULTISPECIES: zf-TFIIB domain-containing protein [Paraeggerthella]MBU5405571.1 zf-TFIIB domain-containing protein [Paraeggerthella hongkongensis]MCD2432610.1 zf-TFIIB domain-containing protein [Paraeggerthella hominis]